MRGRGKGLVPECMSVWNSRQDFSKRSTLGSLRGFLVEEWIFGKHTAFLDILLPDRLPFRFDFGGGLDMPTKQVGPCTFWGCRH